MALNRDGTAALLRAFWDAWRRRDVDALTAFIAEDCVYDASVGPQPGERFVGREAVRDGFVKMLAFDDGMTLEDGAIYVDGHVAVAEWAEVGTTPAGDRHEIRGIDVFEFAGDKIRRKDAFRKASSN
jgi:ketosteroid isomerase-like protein